MTKRRRKRYAHWTQDFVFSDSSVTFWIVHVLDSWERQMICWLFSMCNMPSFPSFLWYWSVIQLMMVVAVGTMR